MKTNGHLISFYMFKLKRIPAVFAGITFLLSGLGKLSNVLGFQYLIVEYGLGALHVFAPFIILCEIVIGTLLLFNIYTRFTSLVAFILIVVFTGIFTYAWLKHDITDCGCFGSYLPITSSPAITYIRNAILMLLLLYVLIFNADDTSIQKWKIITTMTIILSSTFVAGMSYKPFAFSHKVHYLENKTISETPLVDFVSCSENECSELIMFFSYSCPHCINSMENFKAWGTSNKVDKITAYVVIDPNKTGLDSLRTVFTERFPDINVIEKKADSVFFITSYPTSMIIQYDTIKSVIVGELPSHFLY